MPRSGLSLPRRLRETSASRTEQIATSQSHSSVLIIRSFLIWVTHILKADSYDTLTYADIQARVFHQRNGDREHFIYLDKPNLRDVEYDNRILLSQNLQ